jgi:DNA-binding beta-propeller fold protein YncE
MQLLKNTLLSIIVFFAGSVVGAGSDKPPAAPSEKSVAPGTYHLLKKLELGGEGRWDYLYIDSAARRLYIPRSTRVLVLDLKTDSVIGEVPDTKGVHGVAIASEFGHGFTSNGQDSSITMFDIKTLKTLGQAKAGANPDAIICDPASGRVFAFNHKGGDVTALSADSGKVLGTLALGGSPEFAATDNQGCVYVNIEDKNEVVAFMASTLLIKARWPLSPGESPTGMALDRKNMRLFIGCHNNRLIVLDARTGKIVTTLPIGSGVDANGFDPATNLVFSSNGDGSLTVVHEDSMDKFSVVGTVTTAPGARTMALDLKTHKIYLATARFGPAPVATPEQPHPRPGMVPNSFVVLVFGM